MESDLPHSWFEVLRRLVHSPEGRMSMGSLAEEITLTTGGVTRQLDRTASSGLVDRAPCSTVWAREPVAPRRTSTPRPLT